ncbi:cephalosporin hydroxylase family protein [Cylindrospermopsis raciborskii]|uniref:cephalosporin hydroxylase family protein n=1 Tax=Cylindrospermopsis raciborskii TaxID=77022 RepID=UPI0008DDD3EA|nr:cephalosporin hydroxylase family protein [Cylindrospermopsis raciborskii]NLQ05638.1 cephalosporin hydroxylase [Cylindrospermopsis raciborskii MVCC19]OHY34206.1 cephalosporin hydroxylase [Cylindrospermopsis raciborskii MVCC14]
MSNFEIEVLERLSLVAKNEEIARSSHTFLKATIQSKYSYNFYWLGRPIIQYPQDIVAMQELIWSIQPDLIIETGIAHGGSLIFSASMLELNAACGGPQSAEVLGIDIDIRQHNREAIESHPMYKRISMIQGSSIAPEIIEQVKLKAVNKQKILVCLDSNHTHDHVLAELEAYAPLTSVNSYCVVFDTMIEDFSDDMFADRPWGKGNNPKTAVWEYLKTHPEFEIDKSVQHKLLITVAPDGYLRRVC